MSRNVVPRYGSGRVVARWTKDCWKEKMKKKEKGEIGHQFADARPACYSNAAKGEYGGPTRW